MEEEIENKYESMSDQDLQKWYEDYIADLAISEMKSNFYNE